MEQEYNSWIHDGENLISSHQFSQNANLGEWNPRRVWRNFETATQENSKSVFLFTKLMKHWTPKEVPSFLGEWLVETLSLLVV